MAKKKKFKQEIPVVYGIRLSAPLYGLIREGLEVLRDRQKEIAENDDVARNEPDEQAEAQYMAKKYQSAINIIEEQKTFQINKHDLRKKTLLSHDRGLPLIYGVCDFCGSHDVHSVGEMNSDDYKYETVHCPKCRKNFEVRWLMIQANELIKTGEK